MLLGTGGTHLYSTTLEASLLGPRPISLIPVDGNLVNRLCPGPLVFTPFRSGSSSAPVSNGFLENNGTSTVGGFC
jgi:hypothetical protein